MYFSSVGGIIGAASKKRAKPLRQIGEIPAVRRIVLSMQQAGVFPIVVVTGVEEDEIRYQLRNDHVIFLTVGNPEQSPLFDSAKIGFRYLHNKCQKILFTPVNAPMFMPHTISRLCQAKGDVVTPSYHGRGGHPVLIRNEAVEAILLYDGAEGLRGALRQMQDRHHYIEVEDEGVLSLNQEEEFGKSQILEHNQALLHPSIQISLGSEKTFFNNRLKLLLFLIADMQNVKKACELMAISKGKAWSMINNLEKQLGYPVVERQQGGKQGGCTLLTARGIDFLMKWQEYEEKMYQLSQENFEKIFKATESGKVF